MGYPVLYRPFQVRWYGFLLKSSIVRMLHRGRTPKGLLEYPNRAVEVRRRTAWRPYIFD